MTEISHPDPTTTLACPACDTGGRWYIRTDDTTRCTECGHECHRDDLRERKSERGSNLTTADKQRFAGESQARYDMPDAERRQYGKLGGRPSKLASQGD